MAHTERRGTTGLSSLEFRIAGALVIAGLVGSHWYAPEPVEAVPAASSQRAMELATELHALAETLDYDDPRLRPTSGFLPPDPSLRQQLGAGPELVATWKIVDDVPARRMKTIEVRVQWPGAGTRRELSIQTVKAS